MIDHAGDISKQHRFYHKGKEVRTPSQVVSSTMSRTSPALMYAKKTQSIQSSIGRTTPFTQKDTMASIKSQSASRIGTRNRSVGDNRITPTLSSLRQTMQGFEKYRADGI